MCAALDLQVPLDDVLRRRFDLDTMLKSESKKGMLESSTIKNMDKAMKEMPQFKLFAESYRVTGKIIQKNASLLEICDCHAHLWQPGRGWKRRRSEMRKELKRDFRNLHLDGPQVGMVDCGRLWRVL